MKEEEEGLVYSALSHQIMGARGLGCFWQPPARHLFFRSLCSAVSLHSVIMSTVAKHANGQDGSERPAKKVRLEDDANDEEDEEEEAPSSRAKAEPQKASDLYLDTVRVTCPHHAGK